MGRFRLSPYWQERCRDQEGGGLLPALVRHTREQAAQIGVLALVQDIRANGQVRFRVREGP